MITFILGVYIMKTLDKFKIQIQEMMDTDYGSFIKALIVSKQEKPIKINYILYMIHIWIVMT